MKKSIIIAIICSLCSCAINKSLTAVECQLNDSRNSLIKLNIPKYKNRKVVKAGAEEGIEYTFWYKDSAVVYVSTLSGEANLNYENIRNIPNAYDKRFFLTVLIYKELMLLVNFGEK